MANMKLVITVIILVVSLGSAFRRQEPIKEIPNSSTFKFVRKSYKCMNKYQRIWAWEFIGRLIIFNDEITEHFDNKDRRYKIAHKMAKDIYYVINGINKSCLSFKRSKQYMGYNEKKFTKAIRWITRLQDWKRISYKVGPPSLNMTMDVSVPTRGNKFVGKEEIRTPMMGFNRNVECEGLTMDGKMERVTRCYDTVTGHEVQTPTTCDLAQPQNADNLATLKVIGGEIDNNFMNPHYVLLATSRTYCGATLVSHKCAVTAAHCVHAIQNYPELIRYNHSQPNFNAYNDPVNGVVKEIIVHPDYDPRAFHDDIAILKFKSAEPGPKGIRPACLCPTIEDESDHIYSIDKDSLRGEELTISGHGITSPYSRRITRKLMFAKTTVVADEIGKRWSVFDNETHIATLDNNVSFCMGDSGGPAVLPNGCLIGVVSFGHHECLHHFYPPVYTYAPSYYDFITNSCGDITTPPGSGQCGPVVN